MSATADTYTNNAISAVAGGAGGIGSALGSGDTSFLVTGGDGSKFPATGPFILLLGSLAGTYEFVKCTARSSDTLTIVRAQEGTSAQTWALTTSVEQVVSAASFSNIWTVINRGREFHVQDYGVVADGSTDDTSATQAAVNACVAAGGGTVKLAPATSVWGSPVTVDHDNVRIVGHGRISQIKAAAGWSSSSPLLWIKRTSGSYREGIVLADFYVQGQNLAALLTAIELDGVRDALLEGLEIANCKGLNVFMNSPSGNFGAYNHIRSCFLHDSYDGIGVKFTNSEWCDIVDTTFLLFNNAGAIAVDLIGGLNCNVESSQFDAVDIGVNASFCNYTNIVGNQFDEGNTNYIAWKAGQNNIVADNTFNQLTGSGTDAILWDLFGSNNHGNIIRDNTLQTATGWTNFYKETNTGGTASGSANAISGNETGGAGIILLNGVARNNRGFNPLIQLTTPSAPTVSNTGSGGTVAAGTYGVKITHANSFGETAASTNSNTTTSGSTSKITVTSPSAQGNGKGYNVYATQAGGSTYTLQNTSPIAYGTNYVISAPPSSGGATAPGSNTTAGFTQPSVPASTTAYTNAFGTDMWVYVAGGTVTVIAVNGVTTGMTSGPIRVPAGYTITLTYSVAPTWTWQGE